jgi:hypothetical protein
MINELDNNQKKLANLISDISEEAYYAGWIHNIEYELWDTIINGSKTYGRIYIDEKIISKLIDLSKACDGWIYFDERTEETYINKKDWLDKFNKFIRNNKLESR